MKPPPLFVAAVLFFVISNFNLKPVAPSPLFSPETFCIALHIFSSPESNRHRRIKFWSISTWFTINRSTIIHNIFHTNLINQKLRYFVFSSNAGIISVKNLCIDFAIVPCFPVSFVNSFF